MLDAALMAWLTLAALAPLGGMALTFRQSLRTRHAHLLPYALFLGLWSLHGLLALLFIVLGPRLLPEAYAGAAVLLNSLLLIPFHGLIPHVFLAFLAAFLDFKVPRSWKAAYGSMFAAGFLFYLIRHLGRLLHPDPTSPIAVAPVTPFLMMGMLLASLGYAWRVQGRTPEAAAHRRILLACTLGLPLALSGLTGAFAPLGERLDSALTGSLYFLANLPACWLLLRDARDREVAPAQRQLSEAALVRFAEALALTPRELEVVRLVLQGKSNKEIQDALFVSLDTVKKHLYHTYRKTGAKNRIELMRRFEGN